MSALLRQSSEQSWSSQYENHPLNVHIFLYNDNIHSTITIIPYIPLKMTFVTVKLAKQCTQDVYEMACYFDAWKKPMRQEKTQPL